MNAIWIKRTVLIVTVAVAFYYFWPSDAAKVEKKTRQLLSAINKNGQESLPVSAARTHEAVSYLASNIVLKLGEPFPDTMRKSDIAALLQQARMQASRLVVKNMGHQITRKLDSEIWIEITLNAEIEAQGRHDEILGTYRLIWAKFESEWLLKQAEAIEVIKHPDGGDYPF